MFDTFTACVIGFIISAVFIIALDKIEERLE